MNISKKRSKRIQIIVAIVLVLFLLGGGGLFYWLSMTQPTDYNVSTPESSQDATQPVDDDDLPRVDLVTTYLGNDSVAIDAYISAGAKGLVVAAAGGGATTPAMREGMQRAVDAGLVVVMATRTGSGMVGGRSGNYIGAGNLNPYKARILLALALAHTDDPAQIDAWFAAY